MPPPKKNKTGRLGMSVYPPARVGVILGGYRSAPFTQAIRCWAKLMEPEAQRVQALLKPAEWNHLAQVVAERSHQFDPDDPEPGRALAVQVEAATAVARGDEPLGARQAHALAERLRGLEYLPAWCVIWALQWRWDLLGAKELREGEEWWTLASRNRKSATPA